MNDNFLSRSVIISFLCWIAFPSNAQRINEDLVLVAYDQSHHQLKVRRLDGREAMYHFEAEESVMEVGIFRTTQQQMLYVITISDGESGGTISIRIFKESGNDLAFVAERSVIGYGSFEVKDIDGDFVDELVSIDEDFYNIQLESCLYTPGLHLNGFSSHFTFKKYFHLEQENDQCTFVDVTLNSGFRSLILAQIKDFERILYKEFAGRASNQIDAYWLPPLLQYQRLAGPLHRKKRKLKRLSERVLSSCSS